MSEQKKDVMAVLKSEKLKKLFQDRPQLLDNLTPRSQGQYLQELKSKLGDSMIKVLKTNLIPRSQRSSIQQDDLNEEQTTDALNYSKMSQKSVSDSPQEQLQSNTNNNNNDHHQRPHSQNEINSNGFEINGNQQPAYSEQTPPQYSLPNRGRNKLPQLGIETTNDVKNGSYSTSLKENSRGLSANIQQQPPMSARNKVFLDKTWSGLRPKFYSPKRIGGGGASSSTTEVFDGFKQGGGSTNSHNESSTPTLYVRVKDEHGELLCPLSLYENQKIKEVGGNNYDSIIDRIKSELEETYSEVTGESEKLKKCKEVLEGKDTLLGMDIPEQIDTLETSLINNIKLFFQNLRDEYRNEFFYNQKRLIEEVAEIQKHADFIKNNIEIDLNNFPDQSQQQQPSDSSNEQLSTMVQRNYPGYGDDLKQTIAIIESKVEQFQKQKQVEKQRRPQRLNVNNHLKAKLFVLLSESVQVSTAIQPSQSEQKLPTRQNHSPFKRDATPTRSGNNKYPSSLKKSHQKSPQDEVGKYYHELEKNHQHQHHYTDADSLFKESDIQDVQQEDDEESKDSMVFQYDQQQQHHHHSQQNGREQQQHDPNDQVDYNNFPGRHYKGISNAIMGIYKNMSPSSLQHEKDKEMDFPTMKFFLDYMANNYHGSKIKVYGFDFVQKLLGIHHGLDMMSLYNPKLHFDRVDKLLQLSSHSKHKSIITHYERIFFFIQVSNGSWILAEIKTNQKIILIYDTTQKWSKAAEIQNIFALLYEIVRRECEEKLNTNADRYGWVKQFSHHPSLIAKNTNDTGLLALKILSNAYQNKEFTNNRVSPNEVAMIRKKIEKILKLQTENKAFKYLAI